METNLANGKVRLVFVADKTSKELRRLVEFLNDKLMDVEVLAVEIKQYRGVDHTALVPRVVGLTEAARSRKTAATVSKTLTTQAEFMAALEPDAAEFFEHVLALAKQRGHIVYWGKRGFSLRATLPSGKPASFGFGWPVGEFQFHFGYLGLSEDTAQAIRQELMGFGMFRSTSPRVLSANVDATTIPGLKKAYAYILGEVDRICQGDA